jgi:hypothetical protein
MSHRFACLAAIISSVLAYQLPAQGAPADPFGTWRGTSLCNVRPSACRDETVVYRITRTTARDSLALDGRKIVNGAEVEMGVLGCRFDAASGRLTCPIPSGVWRFTIRGDSLVGELRRSDGTKVRDVRTVRTLVAPRGPGSGGPRDTAEVIAKP